MGFRSRPHGRSPVVLLLAAAFVAFAIGTIPNALADDIGITVNVEVLDTSGTATATSTGTTTSNPTSTTTATSTSPATSTGSPTATGSTGPGDETSIGGILFIGGLTMKYAPSINPLDGRVDMTFTVRNTYRRPIDGKATFWVTNWLGGTIGREVMVNVNVKAGETETVTATIRGIGQWGVITGHATFTPPRFLDEVTLIAVTRISTTVYLPWFPAAVVTGCSAFWFAWRRRAVQGLWNMVAGVGRRR